MRRMGLVYGAVDMRLKPDGTYVFLEINPAGPVPLRRGSERSADHRRHGGGAGKTGPDAQRPAAGSRSARGDGLLKASQQYAGS
jgi:hypothetical protein